MEKQSILIIDDTPLQIRILSQILSEKYDVKAASSGNKGIELAQRHNIDLILLDILLEDTSGYEVLKSLKSSDKTRSIPVIFVTSMSSPDDEAKGLSAGAVDYIGKPFVDDIVRLRVDLHMQLLTQMRTIERLSLMDSLTEIRNRRSFNLSLQEEWEKAEASGGCISMIMLDIDHFKNFNDKYGHLCGDTCLKSVASTLKQSAGNDFVFRWGGEEFALMLPGMPLERAIELAESLRKAVADTTIVLKDGTSTSVTISLGVGAIFPQEGDKPEFFCTEVDKALYRAKRDGRDRVERI